MERSPTSSQEGGRLDERNVLRQWEVDVTGAGSCWKGSFIIKSVELLGYSYKPNEDNNL